MLLGAQFLKMNSIAGRVKTCRLLKVIGEECENCLVNRSAVSDNLWQSYFYKHLSVTNMHTTSRLLY